MKDLNLIFDFIGEFLYFRPDSWIHGVNEIYGETNIKRGNIYEPATLSDIMKRSFFNFYISPNVFEFNDLIGLSTQSLRFNGNKNQISSNEGIIIENPKFCYDLEIKENFKLPILIDFKKLSLPYRTYIPEKSSLRRVN